MCFFYYQKTVSLRNKHFKFELSWLSRCDSTRMTDAGFEIFIRRAHILDSSKLNGLMQRNISKAHIFNTDLSNSCLYTKNPIVLMD